LPREGIASDDFSRYQDNVAAGNIAEPESSGAFGSRCDGPRSKSVSVIEEKSGIWQIIRTHQLCGLIVYAPASRMNEYESLDRISAETKAYMYWLPIRPVRFVAVEGYRWRMPVYTGIGFSDVK
jgi:hypothetical protein